MKKFLLSLAMAITAIGASAQNTYNVRAGGGVLGVLNDDAAAAFTTMAQANISLNDYGSWTFSPAVQIAIDGDDTAAMLHINMGYRTRIGNNCLFVPKVGVAGGSLGDSNDGMFLVGPSIDLALELKHFVIGLTGFHSINQNHDGYYNTTILSLTLGYTF